MLFAWRVTRVVVEFCKAIFLCRYFEPEDEEMDEKERELLLATDQSFVSPLKETVLALSNTQKGKLQYNRSPLSSISTSELLDTTQASGFILSDGIFKRKPGLIFERSFQDVSFSDKKDENLFTNQEILIPANNTKRPTMLTDLQGKGNKLQRWQGELMYMRNTNRLEEMTPFFTGQKSFPDLQPLTSALEETTPVYNISHQSIMEMFERREQPPLPSATSFQNKMEALRQHSLKKTEEDSIRKKSELQQRLVPQTELHMDVVLNEQRIEEEARKQRERVNERITRQLQEIDSKAAMELQQKQEEERRQRLELVKSETQAKKNACRQTIEASFKTLNDFTSRCLEDKSFLTVHLRRIEELKVQCKSAIATVGSNDEQKITANANRCELLTKQFQDLVSSVCLDIKIHNDRVNQQRLEAAQRPLVAVQQEAVSINQTAVPAPKPSSRPSSPNELDEYVHPEDKANYEQLQAELKICEEKAATFSSNPNMKSARLRLQTAILSPVNEISDTSGPHLLEKLRIIKDALHGKPVQGNDGRTYRITDYEGALEYCKFQLARRLVEQGETEVDVKPTSAFSTAALITELWIEFPDFGRLALAYFYRLCPYLIPYYFPWFEEDSEKVYLMSRGYKYKGEIREVQGRYIKRMSGVARLYSAIFVTTPRNPQHQNPLGLKEAWRLLAALLNLKPNDDITAAVLLDFLTVAGNAMNKEYGQQFKKILHFICTDYLTRIRQVTTPGGDIGTIARLELLLQNVTIRRGEIPPPPGQLPPRFW